MEAPLNSWKKARARLRKVEIEADQFRVNGYSEIEREKLNLINSTSKTLEQLENYKMKLFNLNSKGRLIKSDSGFSNKPYGEP